MKTLILAVTVTLTLLSTSAFAEDVAPRNTHDETCQHLATVAQSIMTIRQQEQPLSKAINLFESELGREMVIEAYGKHVYDTEEYAQKSIDRFANKWHLYCIKLFKKSRNK